MMGNVRQIKKCFFLWGAFLLLLPGCGGGWRKGGSGSKKKGILSEINIALADGRRREAENRFFDFDADSGEFFLMDDREAVVQEAVGRVADRSDEATYSWVEEQETPASLCKEIYFDFNKYCVRSDQEAVVEFNKEMIDLFIKENKDKDVIIRVDGHACSSAGSRVYNLALSEQRAKIIFDKLVELGIPRENLKIVAWGQERPACDESGRAVVGNRKQQWRNRRVELHAA